MGEKDITEKILADYNDVFADIVNVLLFNGKPVVDTNALINTKDKQQLKVENKIHEEERDCSKVFLNKNIRIALIGLEHQTKIDPDEPFRVIAYDGVSYKGQLLSTDKQRYPVITLVLYFGTERWNKPKSLYEALDIPDEWKPYANNYEINLFEIAFLSDEQVKMFKSDFRIVADYFVQMRKNKEYVPTKENFDHVDAILKTMKALTGDYRFQEAQNQDEKGGAKNMADVFDKFKRKGYEEGFAAGEAAGKAAGFAAGEQKGSVMTLLNLGKSPEEIAQRVNLEVSEVKRIIAS